MKKIYKSFKTSPKYSIKWSNYFNIYENLLSRFINKKIIFVEIGIGDGGSLFMWRKFLGKKAKIIGIELNPDAKKLEKYGFKIFIGDQSDVSFLRNVKAKIPRVDILIDDGSHRAKDQKATFEEMYYHVRKPGVYLIEDIEQIYWKNKDKDSPDNFMTHMKNKIDEMNIRRSMHGKISYSYPFKDTEVRFTNSTNSITFYDNVIVLEKLEMSKAREIRKGK